jgi:alginate O-acetyltransferase complex protein AlgJ
MNDTHRIAVIATALAFIAVGTTLRVAANANESFMRDIETKAMDAEKHGKTFVVGADGWLFFAPELRSVSVGKFWGDAATKVSRASNAEFADPLPAILDFNEQLARAGIELLFVPVPAKAVIYPEMISNAEASSPLDETYRTFYELLRTQGVAVLDLTPTFLEAKKDVQLYCKQDTHWSPQACVIAAKTIAKTVKNRDTMKTVPRHSFTTDEQEIEITGDLWRDLQDTRLPKERVRLTVVKENDAPPLPWRDSPVLLLGDSHNLIYHAGGDMFGQGAGLADHLARELGFPVDVVAVRGSGATPSRLSLLRRGDNVKGKRFVIWCLSVREFTEGQGWRKVPVIRSR